MPRLSRALAAVLLVVPLLAGCGRQAPFFAPLPPAALGSLSVVSTPAGAAILLDGQDTGAVTPDTLESVVAGTHVVRVVLSGYAAEPESLVVDVTVSGLASAAFTLQEIVQEPLKVVLLEGFSNVDCPGCPELAAVLGAVMAEPGHGLDRVLLVKWATNWPNPLDPHYVANPTDNWARLMTYVSSIMGVPTLFADGSLVGTSGVPPTVEALSTLLDGLLTQSPGFAIAVDADVSGTSVAAEATLTSVRTVERAGAQLHLALLEQPVVYDTPPGSEGETEFHWIMRDFVTLPDSPLPLTAGTPVVRSGSLTLNPAWIQDHLYVVAFVQDPATLEVLQAGYAPVSAGLAALQSTRSSPFTASSQPTGGSRP